VVRGAAIAAERGVVVADTKFEFGRDAAGALGLVDEVLTPDSSRFWTAADHRPGRPQRSYDEQIVREWSATVTGRDRTAPGPAIPDDVVADTRARYLEICRQITGERWSG
jgi:phosphoribosylaminoimidazole-succinocarboxamide synthase